MTTLGERIKILRGSMSQQQFADQLSITRQYIALLESDKREPSPLLIDSLCQKFQVRREWLEFGHEPMKAADLDGAPETLVPDLVAILSAYPAVLFLFRKVVDHMTPADWARLNALLDEMKTTKEPPQP
jgi:transcriptional regulator with XRE-family HTH domain